jgi:hypothetical protein
LVNRIGASLAFRWISVVSAGLWQSQKDDGPQPIRVRIAFFIVIVVGFGFVVGK